MASILARLFPQPPVPEPIQPGIYHSLAPQDSPLPYRLHLRIEPDGDGVLIVNAATILHLNSSATAHALLLIQGASDQDAAKSIAGRFRVGARRALADHRKLREQILRLAMAKDLDPVVYLGMDRAEPYATKPSAPYRLDLALTYRIGPGSAMDPLARRRVDRELTTDEWKQILSAAWQAGIPHVTFTGGEPTLREDLVELIGYAQSTGQVSGLLTDGRRLANGAYLDRLRLAGLDHILVALDPQDSASRDGLRAALASDVFTAAHLTVTPSNAAEIHNLLEQLRGLGLAALSLSASESTEQMTEVLGRARQQAARLGFDLIWDLPTPYSATNPISLELESPPQGAGRAFLYVEPDGDVLPAQGVDRVLGNFLRDGWAKIWAAADA
jgi:organic radical activating enzyme